jgi:hypothetical protein
MKNQITSDPNVVIPCGQLYGDWQPRVPLRTVFETENFGEIPEGEVLEVVDDALPKDANLQAWRTGLRQVRDAHNGGLTAAGVQDALSKTLGQNLEVVSLASGLLQKGTPQHAIGYRVLGGVGVEAPAAPAIQTPRRLHSGGWLRRFLSE